MKKNYKKGQVMLLTAIFFVAFSSIVIFGFVTPMIKQTKITSDLWNTKKSFFLSESGAEDVVYRIKNGFTVNSGDALALIDGGIGDSVLTSITDNPVGGTKTIITSSNIGGYIRKTEAVGRNGEGVSFSYGIQTGTGGFIMDKGQINGNVYSNGDIIATGCETCKITGSAIVAGQGRILGDSSHRLDIGTNGVGDAYAHTINGVNVEGNLKCQSGTDNNKSCNTSFPDPASVSFPVTDENISAWKAEALQGGVINGDYTLDTDFTLGPKKIAGDLDLTKSTKLTVAGTLWVTGDLNMKSGTSITLPTSFGSGSAMVVVDGRIIIPGSTTISGSGVAGSYVFLLSNSNCDGTNCGGEYAITVAGSGGAVVLNAQKGGISFTGSASANELTANKIYIGGNNTITYQVGLANPFFVSGPSGSFNVISWKELEN